MSISPPIGGDRFFKYPPQTILCPPQISPPNVWGGRIFSISPPLSQIWGGHTFCSQQLWWESHFLLISLQIWRENPLISPPNKGILLGKVDFCPNPQQIEAVPTKLGFPSKNFALGGIDHQNFAGKVFNFPPNRGGRPPQISPPPF